MAGQFIARKGLISLGDTQISGSLNITQDIITQGTVQASFDASTGTAISGAFDSVSSSLATRVASQEAFSSSLDATFATDSQVATAVAGLNAASSSYLLNTTDTFTGTLNVDGNIGLGITNPGYPFHISSTSVYQAAIKSTGAQYLLIGSNDAGGAGIILDGDSNGDGSGGDYSYIVHENSGVLKIVQDSPAGTNQISFGTAGTENKVIIDTNGNVGIGTTSPNTFLQIVGTGAGAIGTVNLKGTSNHLGYTNNSDTFKGWVGYYDSNSHGSDSDLNIKTGYAGTSNIRLGVSGDSAEAMFISSTGQVGVNTTTPGYTLDVNGNIRAGNANQSALLVAASGTATTQNAIAIQQLTTEGDTIIFADYEPYAEYGIISRNNLDTIDFTGGTSTNNLDSYSITNRSGNSRTAYVKARIGLGSGNSTFGGTVGAAGILFNGDTAAANTLDDYEEGTWTPTLPSGGTFSVASANYVKIGSIVTVTFYIQSVNPTNNSTIFLIGGLPYTSKSGPTYWGGTIAYVGDGNMDNVYPITGNAFTYIYFHLNGTTSTLTNSGYVTRNSGSYREFIMSITYSTA